MYEFICAVFIGTSVYVSVIVNIVKLARFKVYLGYKCLGISKRITLIGLVDIEIHTLNVGSAILWVWVLVCIKRKKQGKHQYLFPSSWL